MARTIQSPGVETKEIDLSLRPDLPIGTMVLVPGFSQNGPTDELIQVTSASDFEQIYGKPTTPVERYFYHTTRAALNSPANVFCSRLPYGEGGGSDRADKYSALVYPVFPRPKASVLEGLGSSHPAHGALYDWLVANNASLPGVNLEEHTLTFTTTADGTGSTPKDTFVPITEGTVTLYIGSTAAGPAVQTAPIPYDATPADIEAIIESTAGAGINDVTVTGTIVDTTGTSPGSSTLKIEYIDPPYKDVYNTTVVASTLKHYTAPVAAQWSIGPFTAASGNIQIDDNYGNTTIINHDMTVEAATGALATTGYEFDISAPKPAATDLVSAGLTIEFTKTTPSGDMHFDAPTVFTNNLLDAGGAAVPGTVAQELVQGSAAEDYSTDVEMTYVDGAGDPTDFSNIYQNQAACDYIAQYVRDNGWELVDSDVYYFGEPSNIEISQEDYREFQENRTDFGTKGGHVHEWKNYQEVTTKGGMGFIMLNTQKLSINEKFEGFYIGVCDNTNLNPASNFDGFLKMKGFNAVTSAQAGSSYTDVPMSRLNFALSAEATGLAGSISEVMENVAPFDLANQQFSDVLSIGVFKIRPSTLNPDITKLDYILSESYVGSWNFYAQQYLQEGGQATSFYVEDETQAAKNFRVMINPNISKNGGDWYDENREVTKRVRVLSNKREHHYSSKQEYINNAFLDDAEGAELYHYVRAINEHVLDSGVVNLKHGENMYGHGAFRVADGNSAETGNIPSKLDRLFEAAENLDLYPLDIVCEAGLGTVYVGTEGGRPGDAYRFDDEKFMDIDHLYNTQVQSADDVMLNYRTVANRFVNFCQTLRKDCIVILDNLRYIFVQGPDVKVLDDKINKYFSKHIYWPLRHLFGTINTSYACTYGQWLKVQDPATNKQVWVPNSGFVAAAMANTDSNFQPWWAPAGFTRGVLSNVNDVAFMPKQKHRDQMYRIGVNPIASFPNDGFVIFGQKTLQSKPSAFDRINVRRMFLYAQRAVRQTIKYFVFEPNTLFTRQQVINVLTPIFENIKQTQGLYDYMIVCDDRNNPPDVIDQNEMVVDIYLKPVRSAEFILVNFYATRTSQDFSELIA